MRIIINFFVTHIKVNAGKLLNPGDTIDTNSVPGKLGITLELCAGIIDKVYSISRI